MKIILASASPRRSSLLKQIGWNFTVRVSAVEEKVTGNAPEQVVMELSRQKAADVFHCLKEAAEGCTEEAEDYTEEAEGCTEEAAGMQEDTEDFLVIGADTIVALEDKILGKPSDEAEAKYMLSLLQAGSHTVYTGVTLCLHTGDEDKTVTFYEATRVFFYPMTEAEIDGYVAGGEPMDKAGAYGIQGEGARYIRKIEGDYNNVVGLPVGRLYQEVQKMAAFLPTAPVSLTE